MSRPVRLQRAAAWPLSARAQQPQRMRRIGVLMRGSAEDSDEQARLTAFLQTLQEFEQHKYVIP